MTDGSSSHRQQANIAGGIVKDRRSVKTQLEASRRGGGPFGEIVSIGGSDSWPDGSR